MDTVDPARLVFVDECGTHTSMTRRRARAARGERARGAVPRNRGPVTTLLAGVSLAGMAPAMTVQGGTDTAVFATYLERVLLPTLIPGQLVVVDNVGAHKPDRIRELVTAAGCGLVFLPAYSPDLSPIEEAFSKIKALVKAAAAHPGGAGRRDRRRPGRRHRRRCRRLVLTRRLPHPPSRLKTAVRAPPLRHTVPSPTGRRRPRRRPLRRHRASPPRCPTGRHRSGTSTSSCAASACGTSPPPISPGGPAAARRTTRWPRPSTPGGTPMPP
jgi:transposase